MSITYPRAGWRWLACSGEGARLRARVARAWTPELACSGAGGAGGEGVDVGAGVPGRGGEAAGVGDEGVARMWIG